MFVMKAGRAFTKFQVISFLSFEHYISIELLISIEHDQKSMILSIKNVCIAIFPVDAALQETSTSTITTLISAPMRYHRNTELFPATIRRAGQAFATMDKRFQEFVKCSTNLSGGEAKFAGGMHRHRRDSRAVLAQSLLHL